MTSDYSLWWNGLALLQKIYWMIAIPFSLLFVIQTILSFIGGSDVDAGGDVDLSIESDAGIDFQFLSIKNMIAFFTMFGWVGIVTSGGGVTSVWSILWAFLAGVLMMLIMATLMYFMGKLTESGTLEMEKAIGKTGSVYLTIPSKRAGMGKVQINWQGFQTLDAMSDENDDIPTGSVVEVVDLINGDILLVKISSK